MTDYKLYLALLNYDIQLFAPEDEGRTEDPTSRKISKARQKGQVCKSQDLPGVVIILFVFIFLYYYTPYLFGNLKSLFRFFFTGGVYKEFNFAATQHVAGFLISFFLKNTLPVLALSFFIAVMANVLQIGLLFTLQPIKPDFGKIKPDPSKMLKKMIFSKETLFKLFKSVVTVIIVGIMAYNVLAKNFHNLIQLLHNTVQNSLTLIALLAFEIIIKTCIFLFVLGIIDYIYQKYEFKQKLKMTKHEVKDERKQMEGDPMVKNKIRQKQREMSSRRMMQKVPEADVVITNPTHYAVALEFNVNEMTSPKVIAKGQDFVALKIIDLARENGVVIYEDPPLARLIFSEVEIGEEIPEALFSALVKVFEYVSKLKPSKMKKWQRKSA